MAEVSIKKISVGDETRRKLLYVLILDMQDESVTILLKVTEHTTSLNNLPLALPTTYSYCGNSFQGSKLSQIFHWPGG